jgi:hypothetical protein
MTELKRCPFCGDDIIDVAWSGEWKVACWNCGLVLHESEKDMIDRAIEIWNHRPIEDELNARIKELEHVMGLDLEGREMK